MLRHFHTLDDPSIYNNLSSHKEMLGAIYRRKCLLIVGSSLLAHAYPKERRQYPTNLRSFLEEVVGWCIRKKVIDQYDSINDFQTLLNRVTLDQVVYKLEEYLVEKLQLQQCLREVLHNQAQIKELHRLLVQIPFRGYLTTTYDTFIEDAYLEVKQSKLNKFYWPSIRGAIEACQNKEPFILKLYGDIDDPCSLSFGQRVTKGLSIANYNDQLLWFLSSFSAIFIGFEGDDPDLEAFKDMVGGSQVFHKLNEYWIIAPAEQLSNTELNHTLNSKKIRPVLFQQSETHAGLMALLDTLTLPEAISGKSTQTPQLPQHSEQPQQSPTPPEEKEAKGPITIFIPYARQDERMLTKIEQILKTMRLQSLEISWSISEVADDEGWKYQIEDPLNTADLILLLVSLNFTATEYSYSPQIIQAIERDTNGEARVIPIILSPCSWNGDPGTPFAKLPPLPSGGRPISKWSNRGDAYQSIDKGIRKAIAYLQSCPTRKKENSMPADPKKVFVVHGRNDVARKEMFTFLRSIGLSPIEWSQALAQTGKGTPFIGEVLDAAFDTAQAVVVLFTGDDEARLKSEYHNQNEPEYETDLTPQPRPNVLFEAGMAFGIQPNRTILVELGTLRPFSDIAGRHLINLDNTPQKRQALAQRLIIAGCRVDLTGQDWLTVGNFAI